MVEQLTGKNALSSERRFIYVDNGELDNQLHIGTALSAYDLQDSINY